MRLSSFMSKYDEMKNGYMCIRKKDTNHSHCKILFEAIPNSVIVDCSEYCASLASGVNYTIIREILDEVFKQGKVPVIRRPELSSNAGSIISDFHKSKKYIIITENSMFSDHSYYNTDYIDEARGTN